MNGITHNKNLTYTSDTLHLGRMPSPVFLPPIKTSDERFIPALQTYVEELEAHWAKNHPDIDRRAGFIDGNKYFRIYQYYAGATSYSGRHMFAFIDKSTGDIYMPATWNAPAKHARGNLYTNKSSCIAEHIPYL